MKRFYPFSILFILIFLGSTAYGADRYWIATSSSSWNSTSNWSTSSGGAGGASIPGSSDMAYFDGARNGSCSINATVNVAGFIMTNYSGTISQNSYAITTGSFSKSGSSGTFNGGSQSITVNGNFTLVGGTFTSTSNTLSIAGNYYHVGGSYSHNNGTVQFIGGNATFDVNSNETFYAVTINKNDASTLTITGSDIIYCMNALNFNNGLLSGGGSISVYGNVTVAPAYDGGTTTLTFLGSAAQSFNLTGATSNYDGDILINKSYNYYVTMSSDLVMDGTGQDLYTQGGGINLNSKTVTVYNSSASTGTVYVQGSFGIAGSGTFNMYRYNQISAGTFSILNGSTFRVYDSYSKYSSASAEFNGGSATLYFDGLFYSTAGNFTSTSGNAYFGGNYTRTGGSFTHNSGTVNFTGTNATLDVYSSETFNKINFNKDNNQTLTITSGDIIYALGDVSFLNGKTATGWIQVYGNVTVGSAWDGGNAELYFIGSATQTFNLSGAESLFQGNIIFNKSSGYQIQMASNLILSASGQNLHVYSGILNLMGKTVTVHNPSLNTGTLFVNGSFQISGSGTLNMYNYSQSSAGTFTLLNGSTFRVYNNFSKFSSSSADFNGGIATLYFDGNFTNTAGNFTSTSGNAYFAGNYTRTGGSFTHNSGTVNFVGNSATLDVYSSETFNVVNFNKNDGQTLTITSGDIVYVLGIVSFLNGKTATGWIQVYNNVTVGAGWDGGNAELYFIGSATQYFNLTGAEALFQGHIILNKSSGYQLVLSSNLSMAASNQNLYLYSGIITLNGKTLTVYNPIGNAGTVNVLGSVSISGSGTFNTYNYTQASAGTFRLLSGPTFRVYNNFSKYSNSSADFDGGTSTLYFNGPFTSSAGNFTSTSNNAYFSSSYSRTGGSFSHNNGTVHFIGNDASIDVYTTETYKNLVFDKGDNQTATISTNDVLHVTGTLTFNNGKAVGNLTAYSNVNVESGWDGGNSALTFVGTGVQNFDLTGATNLFEGDLIINKSSGYYVTMLSNMELQRVNQFINAYSGGINLNSKTVTLHNSGSSTGNMNVLGAFKLFQSGTLNVYNHLHSAAGTFTIVNGATYHVYNNFSQYSNSSADFNGGSGNLTVEGNFTKTSGSFVAPTGNFKLGGNWTTNTGGYTDNGTLVFIGKNATFNNICTFANVVMAKDAGYGLTIANGARITISNAITFTSGLFNTSDNGPLITNCNVTVNAGTDCENPVSYVNGPFTRTLCTTAPTNMYYPIGKGGNFRPTWLEPTQTTTTATTYTVEQFEGFPPNYCVPEDLTCLSKARWYRVERGNNIPMVDPITISYCANDGVTHPSNLRIAKQEGNCWKNMGGVGTSATKGTITSTVDFTEYGDFVLANDTDCMNPLPVQLLSFEGNYMNEVEYLKWVTASEKNNDRFDVMRSEDGKVWTKIGEVQGKGFSESLQEYFYEDHDIPMGATVLYYRLKQVDFDGQFEYHKIIVQDLTNTRVTMNDISVYPNPATDKFSVVNVSNSRLGHTLEVIDLLGHVLLQKEFTANTEVSTMDFPTGIYMLKITNATGMVVDFRKIQIKK